MMVTLLIIGGIWTGLGLVVIALSALGRVAQHRRAARTRRSRCASRSSGSRTVRPGASWRPYVVVNRTATQQVAPRRRIDRVVLGVGATGMKDFAVARRRLGIDPGGRGR